MKRNRYDLIEELFGVRCEVNKLTPDQIEIYKSEVIKRKRERDNEIKKAKYKRDKSKQQERSKRSYIKNRESIALLMKQVNESRKIRASTYIDLKKINQKDNK